MAFENTKDKYVDEVTMARIIERTIDEYCDDSATAIGQYAFHGCTELTEVDVPNVTSVQPYAFSGCTALTRVNAPNATFVGNYALQKCSSLLEVSFISTITLGNGVFQDCTGLTKFSAKGAKNVPAETFIRCSNLNALILRNSESISPLQSTNAISGTPIASGTGYIYVPRSLVDSYKAASNWSTYAAQFRALEDYTVDGTITGDLDESKI